MFTNERLSKLLGHLSEQDTNSSACNNEIPPKHIYTHHPSALHKPSRTSWSNCKDSTMDTTIHKMDPTKLFSSNSSQMDIMEQYIDLWLKSNKNNRFHHAIKQDSAHWESLSKMKGIGYGINFEDFYKLIYYWKHSFPLKRHVTQLSAFNHFQTNIQGLNIHFIHEPLDTFPAHNNRCAILYLHGWPGSFWEFHKVIPVLKANLRSGSTPFTDIIVASLPGFGFSQYPIKYSTFNIIAVASIMKELIETRLNYNGYIISAGDWGSHIAQCIGYQASIESNEERKLLGILLHDTWTSGRDMDENANIQLKQYSTAIYKLLRWTGYQHIQCERPNTIGIALESSPVAILAWIYEMYLGSATGPLSIKEMKYNADGCRIIGGSLSWNDVIFTAMLYWLNGRITTSSSYYADNLKLTYTELRKYFMPRNIKIGIVDWNGSSGYGPNNKYHFRNIVYFNREAAGGHFGALEQPKRYALNVTNFAKLAIKKS